VAHHLPERAARVVAPTGRPHEVRLALEALPEVHVSLEPAGEVGAEALAVLEDLPEHVLPAPDLAVGGRAHEIEARLLAHVGRALRAGAASADRRPDLRPVNLRCGRPRRIHGSERKKRGRLTGSSPARACSTSAGAPRSRKPRAGAAGP